MALQLWLVVLGCAAILGLLALFAALRVELSARGFGEPSGNWAAAFGLAFSLGAVSGVCGKGVPLALSLHAFGRRFPLRIGKRKPPEKPPREAEPSAPRESPAVRLERFLHAPSSLEPLLRAGRRIALDELSLDAAYGFRDIALTGRVAGVLYALSGLLPAGVQLRQRPCWDGSERWELSVTGRVTLYPTLVLLELLWYMLRVRVRRSRARPQSVPPAQPTLENPS